MYKPPFKYVKGELVKTEHWEKYKTTELYEYYRCVTDEKGTTFYDRRPLVN